MSLILALLAGGVPLFIVVGIFLALMGAFGNKAQQDEVSEDLGCGCLFVVGLIAAILFLIR